MKLVVITGASKGFGRQVAYALARALAKELQASSNDVQLHFALFGRDCAGLEETRRVLLERDASLMVSLHRVELESEQADAQWDRVVQQELPPATDVHQLWIINNAGSLGKLAPVSELTYVDIREAMQVNVTMVMHVTIQLLQTYAKAILAAWGSGTGQDGKMAPIQVIHVSSLAALQPFDTWSLYCTGKAARDMFHRSLALEYPAHHVRVLNYAPGPLDTQMQQEIRQQMPHVPLRQQFEEMHRKGTLVDAKESAETMVQLLWKKDGFESGDHVDYYDAQCSPGGLEE